MKLQGSCHCKAIRFSVESHEPVPFMRCYCSICRKTAGTAGYAINLGAHYDSLEVEDPDDQLRGFHARIRDKDGNDAESPATRHFCGTCGTALWSWDPRWPELVHPHVGAINTPLPAPAHTYHIFLGSKAPWVEPQIGPLDKTFDEYPDISLADWHAKHYDGE